MSETRSNEMTLKDLLQILWANAWILALSSLLCGALAAVRVMSETPAYTVDALIQVETKDGGRFGAANPLGAMADVFEIHNATETEIEIVKSRLVLSRAAQMRHLDLVVAPKSWGRQARLLHKRRPKLALERLDVPSALASRDFELDILPQGGFSLKLPDSGELLRGQVGVGIDSASNPHRVGIFVRSCDARPGDVFYVARLRLSDAAEGLGGQLSVSQVGKETDMISMTLEGDDPDEAAATLNAIANSYVFQNVEQKSAEAQKTLEFLEQQLPGIKQDLEESEEKLNRYRSATGSVDLTEEAKVALAQQVEVQQKLFEARQKRQELGQLFRPDHPNIRTADSAIATLQDKLSHQESQVKTLPMQQQEVVRLTRDVQVNTELYTSLLNNAQQLRVVKAGEVGNVRVVDYAVPNYIPTRPKKRAAVLVGLLLGLVLGSGIVLVRRLFQGGVEDPRVIEKELGLPVYATIPHSDHQERLMRAIRRREKGTHLLAQEAGDDLAMESFRSLRTTLHFSMLDAPNRILLLVGPSPTIGKSFVSTNFAATLAMAGSRVLLMDADLRRGHIHQHFGRERGMGISDILAGKVASEQAVAATEIQNLSFLSTGTVPPNPSELLMHENFARLLEDLKPRFDYIVIDSAPVLAVTDAVILGKLAGTSLMVLKHGRHPLAEVEACQKRLAQADVALNGVVFNDVFQKGGAYAYRYGAAAYNYKYRRE